jgi:hypothetical protein
VALLGGRVVIAIAAVMHHCGLDDRREIREGGLFLVLIPPLILPISVAIVVFVFVQKHVDHGRSGRVLGAVIGMAPAAMPLNAGCYLLSCCL